MKGLETEVALDLIRTDLALGKEVDVVDLLDLLDKSRADPKYINWLENKSEEERYEAKEHKERADSLHEALSELVRRCDLVADQQCFFEALQEAKDVLEENA